MDAAASMEKKDVTLGMEAPGGGVVPWGTDLEKGDQPAGGGGGAAVQGRTPTGRRRGPSGGRQREKPGWDTAAVEASAGPPGCSGPGGLEVSPMTGPAQEAQPGAVQF